MSKFIDFNNVSKSYKGDIVALDDVTFSADYGDFFFVIGPSGAGKSTLIRLLIRQELPTIGDISFGEVDVTKIPRKMLSVYRQQLGVVFQDLKLIPTKTIQENIEFALEISGKKRKEIPEIADYLLGVVGLQKRKDLFPDDLSGGEMQKTAIARALANEPKLFIADEPTGNLDPETSLEILELLKTINSWGTTVMVVSHDQDIVNAMQTRVIHMQDGKIVSDKKGGYELTQKQSEKSSTKIVPQDKKQSKKQKSKKAKSKPKKAKKSKVKKGK